MNLHEFHKLDLQKRNEIITFYHLKRSGQVKTRTVSAGIDIVDDDGVREGDIEPLAYLTVEQVSALMPLNQEKKAEQSKEVEKPKRKYTKRK